MLHAAIRSAHRQPASAEDVERDAYNAAFSELEFSWRWDARTYRELLRIPEEKSRIRAYLEGQQPHLLRAYDPGFLCDLIYDTKRRWLAEHATH